LEKALLSKRYANSINCISKSDWYQPWICLVARFCQSDAPHPEHSKFNLIQNSTFLQFLYPNKFVILSKVIASALWEGQGAEGEGQTTSQKSEVHPPLRDYPKINT